MYYEDSPTSPKIDEVRIARDIMIHLNLVYTDGAFFNEDGRFRDEDALRREIYRRIIPYTTSNVPRRVENVLQVLRMEAAGELPLSEGVIHLKNGTYHLVDGFSEHKMTCRHRLNVSYDPNCKRPELWLKFLHDLLEEEDIATLQEFLGYCLLPVNYGQKMLIITGRGGEGKSRIGVIMKQMLGESMNYGSIAKVETNAFARADLEHKLLMVDDDLRLTRLPTTNTIKSLITAEQPVDLERKGKQSYQGKVYARFLAFGNGALTAENDSSYGFFRRQIILQAKPRDPDRVDNPYLASMMRQELDSIFMWCLEGLFQLLGKDFRFSISQTSRETTSVAMGESNNVLQFLCSRGYVVRECQASASSRQLYNAYLEWCTDNMSQSVSMQKFSILLKEEARYYGLRYDNNIPTHQGKRVRGFWGIRLADVADKW